MPNEKNLDLFDLLEREPRRISQHILSALPTERWAFVEGLLLTGTADESLVAELEVASTKTEDEDFLGAVQFLLFSHKAEKYKEEGDRLHHSEATSHINHASAKRFLEEQYSIPRHYIQSHIDLHRVGTTSFILKVKDRLVLKILNYRHRHNPRIASATKAYEHQFGDLVEFAPKVHLSSEYFVIMDFVPGKTLSEEIEAAGPLDLDELEKAADRIDSTERSLKELVAILAALHSRSKPIIHMDLSPENIILQPSSVGRNPKVVLIDFGYNYLLQENFGTLGQIRAAKASVAPELDDTPSRATGRSDLFSFGMLILSMVNGRADDLADLESHLDAVWQHRPEFGDLIESLIDSSPENRLAGKTATESDYEFLTRRITSAFELFRSSHIEQPRGWQKVLSNLPVGLFGQYGRVLELTRQYRAVSSSPELAMDVRRLLHYSIIAQVAHNFLLAVFFLYLCDDLGLLDLNDMFPLSHLRNILGVHDLSPGSWKENWAGRIACFTAPTIAIQYYQYIHSGVSARGVNTSTEFWLRLNSFCFAFPILWMIVRPSHWPFCYFVAGIFVNINNYRTLATAKKAKEQIRERLGLPLLQLNTDRFLVLYDAYARNCAIYTASLLLAGIALATGFARDEYIYALIVGVVINLGVIYVTDTTEGPTIRSNLMRLYDGCRRIHQIRLRS